MAIKEIDRDRINIIAGMPRAGTTFLYHNLQKHPNAYLAKRKEICYFERNYDKELEWFLGFYSQMKSHEVAFDVCPAIFTDHNSIERILEFNPNSRVILSVREPVSWTFSRYEQIRGNYRQVPPFKKFLNGCYIEREGKKIKLDSMANKIKKTILNFQHAFGENLLLFDFNILGNNPVALLKAVERFAGMPPFFEKGNFTETKINAGGRKKFEFFDRFIQKKGVADLVARLLPRPVILRARSAIDEFSSKNVKVPKYATLFQHSGEEVGLVKNMFKEDSLFIEDLFAEHHLVLGNGRRFG
jgi:hypothetical protein